MMGAIPNIKGRYLHYVEVELSSSDVRVYGIWANNPAEAIMFWLELEGLGNSNYTWLKGIRVRAIMQTIGSEQHDMSIQPLQ